MRTVAVTSDSPLVRLELDSRPECLALVRGMLAGVGEALGFVPELLDDLRTAVSEACNNVVMHAYGGDPGALVVSLTVCPRSVEVSVRDRGSGFPYVPPYDDRIGLGLAVIGALADRAEFLSLPEGGAEVRMGFARAAAPVESLDCPAAAEPDQEWLRDLAGEMVVCISPVGMLGGILGRIIRTLAASARFSLDRFSDLYLVTDAIAAHAQRAASSTQLGFAIAAADRRLELAVGPFRPGSGEQLGVDPSSKGPDSPLGFLADELATQPAKDAELLRLVLVDHWGRRGARARDGNDGQTFGRGDGG
ncbi:MAG: ATP-binding protein [Solirubrobacteraceae bacterium]